MPDETISLIPITTNYAIINRTQSYSNYNITRLLLLTSTKLFNSSISINKNNSIINFGNSLSSNSQKKLNLFFIALFILIFNYIKK